MLVPVFENWPERTSRRLSVPIPVKVDLARGVIQAPDDGFIGQAPLWLRSEGADLTGTIEGSLHGWVRSTRGSWLAIVELRIPSGSHHGLLRVTHLCPARYIRPSGAP